MTLTNLAYPEFYPVNCSTRIFAEVICTNSSMRRLESDSAMKHVFGGHLIPRTNCFSGQVLFDGFCHLFSTQNDTHRHTQPYEPNENFKMFLTGISKVTHNRLLFVVGHPKFICLKFNRAKDKIEAHPKINKNKTMTLFVNSFLPLKSLLTVDNFQLQTMKCSSGELVSAKVAYLISVNCTLTQLPSQPKVNFDGMSTKNSSGGGRLCPDLYFATHDGSCSPLFESCHGKDTICILQLSPASLSISDNTIMLGNYSTKKTELPTPRQGILFSDCTEDEINKPEALTTECTTQNAIQCTSGCRRCFLVQKFCVHELDVDGNLLHCPSGAHLKNCQEMECNNMLKCHNSYCVPFRYIDFSSRLCLKFQARGSVFLVSCSEENFLIALFKQHHTSSHTIFLV